jgi:hypothetical protein
MDNHGSIPKPRKAAAGKWQARYHHPDDAPGIYRSAGTFLTKAEAVTEAAEVLRQVARGQWTDPKLAETPLEDVVSEYRPLRASHKEPAPETATTTRSTSTSFRCLGTVP